MRRLAAETPASYIAFDLLAHDDAVLLERPLHERRAALLAAVHATPAGPSHAGHHRHRRRRRLVRPVRGRRARRRRRQAARRPLPAGQAGAGQGQARTDGRVRRRRVPHPQGRARRRLAPPRPVRRQRSAAARRRGGLVHGGVPPATARGAGTADPRRARRASVAGVGGVEREPGAHRPPAGDDEPVERRQGPVVGGDPRRAGRRGDVRAAGEPPLPPRRVVRPVAPGSGAGELPLRPARSGGSGPVRRPGGARRAASERLVSDRRSSPSTPSSDAGSPAARWATTRSPWSPATRRRRARRRCSPLRPGCRSASTR